MPELDRWGAVMRKVLFALVAVSAATMFLAACGDDDSGGDVEALPADEFAEQATSICADASEAIDAEVNALLEAHADELAGVESPDDIPDDLLNELVQIGNDGYQEVLPDLRAIAPEGDEDTWTGILDDLEDILDGLEDDPRAIFGEGDEDPFAELEAAADELGVAECGGA